MRRKMYKNLLRVSSRRIALGRTTIQNTGKVKQKEEVSGKKGPGGEASSGGSSASGKNSREGGLGGGCKSLFIAGAEEGGIQKGFSNFKSTAAAKAAL